MMRRAWLWVVLLALGLLLLARLLFDDGSVPQAADQNLTTVSSQSGTQLSQQHSTKTASWPPPFPELKRVPLLDTGPALPAAQSLAATRYGDPRSPPIARDTQRPLQPTREELADPQAYQRYEANQHQQLLASFADAAQQEVPRLLSDIERGRQSGIDPVAIAKMEEKARRLAALEQELRQQHPEWKRTQR